MMDTARIYYDSNGDERTIWQMVKDEPEWAAARIQEGEKAVKQLETIRKGVEGIGMNNRNCDQCQDVIDEVLALLDKT